MRKIAEKRKQKEVKSLLLANQTKLKPFSLSTQSPSLTIISFQEAQIFFL